VKILFFLRWSAQYIEWLLEPEEIGYYRREVDGVWMNYSAHHDANCVDPMSMSSDIKADLLVNVDGVSLIVPRCPMSVYKAYDHILCDNAGVSYGSADVEDGNYICNNLNMAVICPTLLPPDSSQSIHVMLDSVWTVPEMLAYWNFPSDSVTRTFSSINYFEKWMDSFDLNCFQLKQNPSKITYPSSRIDLVHNYFSVSAGYSEADLTSYLASCGVVRKGSLYLPYRDMYNCKLWDYNGVIYSRVRNGNKRVYVKKKYKEIESGWWYEEDIRSHPNF